MRTSGICHGYTKRAPDRPVPIDMVQAYLEAGQTETAVLEFFVRKVPPQRNFLIAAGLEQVLKFLQGLRFSDDELSWVVRSGRFSPRLIDYFSDFHFSGDVHAMPEGTVFLANEPILRITAPLPEAQLVETRLIKVLRDSGLRHDGARVHPVARRRDGRLRSVCTRASEGSRAVD